MSNRSGLGSAAAVLIAFIGLLLGAGPAASEGTDWTTGLPRQPIHVDAWPGGKKVAVCFIFSTICRKPTPVL